MSLARKNSILSKTINVDHSANGDTLFIPHSGIVNISGILTATSGNFSSQTVFASGSAAAPGISIIGDTDTGIAQLIRGGESANTLSLVVGGTERMRIEPGNVKILTPTDNTAEFSISNSIDRDAYIVIDGGSNTGRSAVLEGRANGAQEWYICSTRFHEDGPNNGMALNVAGSNPMTFRTNNTEKMRITSGGNVGIGTSSPQQKFVVSNAGAEGMEIIPALNANESRIQTYNRSTSAWNKFSINCSTFELFTNGATTTIFGNASGNVGIGTSSPSTKLDVFGTAGGGATIRINDGTQDLRLYTSTGIGVVGTISNSSLGFHTNNTERMRITSAGNVGIGTSSPAAGAVVVSRSASTGAVADIPAIVLTNRNTTNATFVAGGVFSNTYRDVADPHYSAGMWFVRAPFSGNFSSSGDIVFGTGENVVQSAFPTERMRITSGGNVGIGTGSSIDTSYKLNVLGSIRSDASSTSAPSIIGIKDFTNQSTGDNISSATYGYATSNGSYAIRNLTVNTYFKINSGITNSGSSIGITNNNLRNYALTNDIGTLSALYGIYNQYGHYNTSVVSPTTTTAIGIQHILWVATGTITNAFDIYCSNASSGATVTNRWGIFVEHTGNNYFGGNLGIGVQPPSYRLHVVRSGTGIIGRFSDNATQTLDLGVTASAGAYLDNPNSGYIDNRIGGVSKFKIGGDGSLTAPDVYGDTVGATNRDLFIDNTGLIGYVSSIRSSKTEINNLNNVSWLRELNPVSYYYRKKDNEGNYTDEPDGNKDYGLIAEDVEAIAPELCFYDIVNNVPQLRGIHYSKLITPMLKYIQQLEQELQNIRNRVSALEGE